MLVTKRKSSREQGSADAGIAIRWLAEGKVETAVRRELSLSEQRPNR